MLSRELDFGPYYGKNLSALWDRLTTDVERPVHLIWTDAAKSREHLGAELFGRITQLLRDVEASDIEIGYAEKFTFEIQE